jgi:hypothetical protein
MDTPNTVAKRIERLERELQGEGDLAKRETIAMRLVEEETKLRVLQERSR